MEERKRKRRKRDFDYTLYLDDKNKKKDFRN